MLVAAISDEDTFLVEDALGSGLGVVVGEGGVILGTELEGSGEMAGGVDVAEENLGESRAASLAGVPGFEESGDAVEPEVRIRVAAGGDGNNGPGVRGGHGFDELVLTVREREGAVAALAFAGMIEAGSDEDDIRFGGELFGAIRDDAVGGDDTEAEMSAEETLLLGFNDELVWGRRRGEG